MIERYRKIIRRRRISAVFMGLLGAVILAVLFLSEGRVVPRYMESFFAGSGFAALTSGGVNFFRKGKLLQDEESLRKAAVAELDERSTEVMQRSGTLALNVLVILLWVGMIVAGFLSRIVCYTLLSVLCVGLAVWFACYAVIWKML